MIAGYYRDEGPTLDKMRQLARSLVYDQSAVTEEAIEARYAESAEPEVVAVNAGPHWAHQSLAHELDKVAAQTLLIWGQEDRASPLDHSLVLLRTIQDARLVVLPRCGHSAQVERPDDVNHLVLDFLGE